MHPWAQKFCPVLGLGSGERLLWRHFQTPVLYWINFSMRLSEVQCSTRANRNFRRPVQVFFSASSKPTTEFEQPRLSRVKARPSPARGYKFGCVCSYMAGHEDAGVVTGHIGTNTPKFVPPRWDERGCANSGGFGAR